MNGFLKQLESTMAKITPIMLSLLDQSSGAVGLVESIEVTHPNWSEALRYVVNSSEPLILTHEDGQVFEYKPTVLTVERGSDQENLDQSIKVSVGDLGQQIPDLIDRVYLDDVPILPVLNYRAYLTGIYSEPSFVDKGLLIENVSRSYKGSTFEANAPNLNDSGTGELYVASTDPSLKGFY